MCGTHRARPSRIPTATRTASSSSLRPQLAIERARSQSPLCGATEAKNFAFSDGSTKESSMSARHFGVPGCQRRIVYWAAELEEAWLKWSSMTDKSPGMGPCSRDSMPKFDPGERGCLALRPRRQDLRAKTPVLASYPQATMFNWH